jgi:hypothetical protein
VATDRRQDQVQILDYTPPARRCSSGLLHLGIEPKDAALLLFLAKLSCCLDTELQQRSSEAKPDTASGNSSLPSHGWTGLSWRASGKSLPTLSQFTNLKCRPPGQYKLEMEVWYIFVKLYFNCKHLIRFNPIETFKSSKLHWLNFLHS